MKTELSMPNKKQSNYLFKQNKNQSPDVKMKYRNCYASGMIHDYMEKSSAFLALTSASPPVSPHRGNRRICWQTGLLVQDTMRSA